MSAANLGKAFWRDYFGEEYWRNYGGIGEDYTEKLMQNMPTFPEIAKVVPEGKAALEGKSILCLGSAFGHELLHQGVRILRDVPLKALDPCSYPLPSIWLSCHHCRRGRDRTSSARCHAYS